MTGEQVTLNYQRIAEADIKALRTHMMDLLSTFY